MQPLADFSWCLFSESPLCLPLIYANKRQNHNNQSVFLCDIMQPAAFLCVICVICGRIFTQEYSINQHNQTPEVSRRSRWFTQTKPKTTLTTNCLSLRDNAACCICLRHLRYLRENIHIRVLNQSAQGNPNVSRRSRWFTQTNHITTLTTQSVFLCDIMQLAAFLCVICVICGRIFT